MKLVINSCYGGFQLSPKAFARLAELRGQKAYFFTGGLGRPLSPVSVEDAPDLFFSAFNTPSPSKSPTAGEWAGMSLEERKACNARQEAEYVDDCRDNRADPLLVRTVEELGEAASGACSKLRVVEIPDGVEYQIDEYDGLESVHEKHRVWR